MCRIIDKAPQASDKSKALVVWSRTLELLDKLDLAHQFVECGLRAEGVNIYGGGKRLVHVAVDNTQSPFAYPLMLPQCETERLWPSTSPDRDWRSSGASNWCRLSQSPTESLPRCRRDGKDEITRAAWLIGCDGAHSTVQAYLSHAIRRQGQPEPVDAGRHSFIGHGFQIRDRSLLA